MDRCIQLGAKVITFGGGDPLLLKDINTLLKHVASAGVEVHIDTNGIRLTLNQLETIAPIVSLLALPLDGPTSDVHDSMRAYPGHFNIVHKHLQALRTISVRTKVNTVVAGPNARLIQRMCELIESLEISRWSLYQFWPLIVPDTEATKHYISDIDFRLAVDAIPDRLGDCVVEKSTVLDRFGSYFFVSHDGEVYTHNPSDMFGYINLGSIFQDQTIEVWSRLNIQSIRRNAVSRYNSLIGDRL